MGLRFSAPPLTGCVRIVEREILIVGLLCAAPSDVLHLAHLLSSHACLIYLTYRVYFAIVVAGGCVYRCALHFAPAMYDRDTSATQGGKPSHMLVRSLSVRNLPTTRRAGQVLCVAQSAHLRAQHELMRRASSPPKISTHTTTHPRARERKLPCRIIRLACLLLAPAGQLKLLLATNGFMRGTRTTRYQGRPSTAPRC